MFHRNYQIQSALLKTVVVIAAVASAALAVHADSDWGSWLALPDRHQGAIDLRTRQAGGKGDQAIDLQLRNRYKQDLTLTLRLNGVDSSGKHQQIERVIALQPGELKDRGIDSVALVALESAAIVKVEFSDQAPVATSAGFSFAAANLENRRAELTVAQQVLKQAEQAQLDAQQAANSARQIATSSPQKGKVSTTSDITVGQAGAGDIAASQNAANSAADRAAAVRKAVQTLEQEVKEGEDAAAAAVPKDNSTVEAALLAPQATATNMQTATLQQLVDMAKESAKAGHWSQVEGAFREMRANAAYPGLKDTDKASISYNLGNALGQQKRFADAEVAYRDAVKLDPKNASYEDGLGIALASQGKLAEAEPAFQAAINLDKTNPAYPAHLKTLQDARKSQGK